MRRSLVIMLLLLVLSVGGLCLAHRRVDAAKDAVTLDETVLYGEKSSARGLVVDSSFQCDYRLFWNIRQTFGEEPEVRTAFAFSQAEKRAVQSRVYSGAMFHYVFGGYGASTTGSLAMEDESAPVRDVASRTRAGEKHSELVYLKDYYDYFPILLDFDLPISIAMDEDIRQSFADYFRIPIKSDYRVEITVEKNASGDVFCMGISSVAGSEMYLESESVITDTGCFFTLTCSGWDGILLDTSLIPGGYGIYYLPYAQGMQIQTAFRVDPAQAKIVSLQASADKKELLLVTQEGGAYMLTILDAATAEPLCKMSLFDDGENFWKLFIQDNFLVAQSGSRLAVVTKSAYGVYTPEMTVDTVTAKEYGFSMAWDAAVDYDGSHLAVAAFQQYKVCGYDLAVFDGNGLSFLGRYDNSLDIDLPQSSGSWGRSESVPLSVIWDE